MRNFKEAGLKTGTCAEPTDPEHIIERPSSALPGQNLKQEWY